MRWAFLLAHGNVQNSNYVAQKIFSPQKNRRNVAGCIEADFPAAVKPHDLIHR